jgi:hypothetical protein
LKTGTLAETGQLPGTPPTTTSRRSRLIRGIVCAAIALPLLWLVSNVAHTEAQYDKTTAALHAAHDHIAHTAADLASVRRNLLVVDGQVDQTTTALTNDANQLHEVLAALTNEQTGVSSQQSIILSLHACLGGVEQSLNALAVGDANSAGQALTSVAPDCSRVLAADG